MTMSKLGVSGSASASVGSGASANRAGAGRRSSGPGGWHPTVLYLMGLIVLEVIVVAFLSRHLLK